MDHCHRCESLEFCRQCHSEEQYYRTESGQCEKCGKIRIMLIVNEDSCCSIIESCHPNRVTFLAVVVVSVLALIGMVFMLIKLIRKWLRDRIINRQHKI